MNVNPIFSNVLSPANANSASAVQQQADVLSLPTSEQFLTQLQQVQSPQQYQAMISQMSGQPVPADTTATNGANTTAKHCQGGGAHQSESPSPLGTLAASQTQASTTSLRNQSLLANLFGSTNLSQSAVL